MYIYKYMLVSINFWRENSEQVQRLLLFSQNFWDVQISSSTAWKNTKIYIRDNNC